jgi:hypothetical protein
MRSDQGTAEEERITVVDEREELSTPYGSNPAPLAGVLPVWEVLV